MITLTNYRFEDIEDHEEFINNLYIGLKHYEKKNMDFKFKITWYDDCIELQTIKMNESVN